MKTRVLPVILLLGGGLLSFAPLRAQTERSVRFNNGTQVAITVPMGYSFEGKTNTDGSVLIVMENPVWNIRMEALVAVEADPQVTTRKWQEDKLVSFIASALTIAEEDDYNFQRLPVASGSGVYCVFTAHGAPVPKPGESIPGSYQTAGLKAWPGCVVVFRVTSADKTSPEYQEAMQVFTHSFLKL